MKKNHGRSFERKTPSYTIFPHILQSISSVSFQQLSSLYPVPVPNRFFPLLVLVPSSLRVFPFFNLPLYYYLLVCFKVPQSYFISPSLSTHHIILSIPCNSLTNTFKVLPSSLPYHKLCQLLQIYSAPILR